MPGESRVSNVSSAINEVVSRRTESASPAARGEAAGERERKSGRGDEISLSELAEKLFLLLNILNKDGRERELAGFHYIMKQFIERPDSYEIQNFVDTLLDLHAEYPGHFSEILLQADDLQEKNHNPTLWLGILSRLSPPEAVSFTDISAEIFQLEDREMFVKRLVAFLEEVRQLLNEHQRASRSQRAREIAASRSGGVR